MGKPTATLEQRLLVGYPTSIFPLSLVQNPARGPAKRLHFPTSFADRYSHVTKVWPIKGSKHGIPKKTP